MSTEAINTVDESAPPPAVTDAPEALNPDEAGIAAAAAVMDAHKSGIDVNAADAPAASDEARDIVAAAMFGENKPEPPAAEPEPKAEAKPEDKSEETPQGDDKGKGDTPEPAATDFEKAIQDIEDEYGSVVAAPMREMAKTINALKSQVTPAPERSGPPPAQAFHDFIDGHGQRYAGMLGASGRTATKDQLKRREDVGLTASAMFNTMAAAKPPITPAERAALEEQAILLAMEAVADPTRFRASLQNREASRRTHQRTHAVGQGNVYQQRSDTPRHQQHEQPKQKSADDVGIDIVSRMLAQR